MVNLGYFWYNQVMSFVWDYDPKQLRQTAPGRRLLLERLINGGLYLSDKIKIPLKELRANWAKFI